MSADRPRTGLILAEPRTLGELVAQCQESSPELHTRVFLSKLRQEITQLIDAALRDPEYRRESNVRVSEDDKGRFWKIMQSKDDATGGSPDEKRRQAESIQSMQLLSNDACLGASFVREKYAEKGDERVLHYIRSADVATLARAGRKLRVQDVERVAEEWRRWNAVVVGSPGEKAQRLVYSATVRSLLESEPRELLSVTTFRAWQQTVAVMEHCQTLARTMRVPEPEKTPDYLRSIGLLDHCRMTNGIYPGAAGVVEMGVFACVFCAAHGRQAEQALAVPADLLPQFLACFEEVEGDIQFSGKARERMADAAERVFPGDAAAIRMLPMAYELFRREANHDRELQIPGADDETRLRRLFPNGRTYRALADEAPQDMTDADMGALRELAPRIAKVDTAMITPLPELVAMEKSELIRLARAYPAAVEWHSVLLDGPDFGRVALLIRRLMGTGDPCARMVASELLLLALSFDREALEKDIPAQALCEPRCAAFAALRERNAPLAALVESLNGNIRQYALSAFGLMLTPADMEQDEAQSDDYTKYLSGELGILYYIEHLNNVDHPPLFHIQAWHPYYREAMVEEGTLDVGKRGPAKKSAPGVTRRTSLPGRTSVVRIEPEEDRRKRFGPYDVAGHFRITRPRDRARTMDYIARRQICSTPHDWARFLTITAGLKNCTADALELLRPRVSQQAMAEICQYALHEVVGEEMIRHCPPEDFRDAEILSYSCVDFPFGLLLDPSSGALSVPAPWAGEARELIASLLPAERKLLEERLRAAHHLSFTDVLPDVTEEHAIVRMFTGGGALDPQELFLAAELLQVKNNGLAPYLAPTLLRSPLDVQRKLIAKLPVSHARDLVLSMLAESARATGDRRTVRDAGLETWAAGGCQGTAPAAEAIAPLLRDSAPLRKAVADELLRNPDAPFTEIGPRRYVGIVDRPAAEGPGKKRARKKK